VEDYLFVGESLREITMHARGSRSCIVTIELDYDLDPGFKSG